MAALDPLLRQWEQSLVALNAAEQKLGILLGFVGILIGIYIAFALPQIHPVAMWVGRVFLLGSAVSALIGLLIGDAALGPLPPWKSPSYIDWEVAFLTNVAYLKTKLTALRIGSFLLLAALVAAIIAIV